ncbi:hypothetical protein CEP54_010075 [Fusarium duplospermum]|uniref:Uncharacterized protein n=1 Tax=Fusarium duplospermum TaxID=1325734 RepID=A0A428PLY6_9HYPO|nr:hypothetical protein CEP54_010075 [Fusarium duplospermum]
MSGSGCKLCASVATPDFCGGESSIISAKSVSFIYLPWLNGANDSCAFDHCKNKAYEDGYEYCRYHICDWGDCERGVYDEDYVYCRNHICNEGDCPDAIDREYDGVDTTYCTSHKCSIDLCSGLRDTDKTSHGLGYLCIVCARTVAITRQMSRTPVSPLWGHYARPAPTHTSKRRPGSE